MSEAISLAAQHYGAAMCPPGDSSCAEAVGRAWEQDIDRRLGIFGNTMPTPERKTATFSSSSGKVGEVRYVDGVVSLCFDSMGSGGGQRCSVLGEGNEAYQSAIATLTLMGFHAMGS